MIAPYTRIRELTRITMEEASDREEIVNAVIDGIMNEPEVLESLVNRIVGREVNRYITELEKGESVRAVAAIRPEPNNEPRPVKLANTTRDILVDMASMTRPQLELLALDLEKESDRAAEYAGFVRVIASQLANGEKVKDRFSVEELQRAKSRVNVLTERKVFIGDKFFHSNNGKAISR